MQGKNVERFPLNVGMTPDLNDEYLRGLDTEASKQKVGDQQSRVKLSFNLKKLKLDLAVLNQMQQ